MHRLRIVCCPFVLMAVALLAQSVRAQDDPNFEIGLKPYGSYHMGNIDTISLANGSLGVDIPLISYPQRGGKLTLDFSLHYSNGSSYQKYVCYTEPFGSECVYEPFGTSADIYVIDKQALTYVFGGASSCSLFNSSESFCNFSVSDSDGASHLYAPTSTASTAYRSIDASGLLGTSTAFTDPQGIVHTSLQITSGFTAITDSREDANGNEITYSSTAGWTDTMGRNIPAIPTPSTSGLSNCPQPPNVPLVPTSAAVWSPPGPNGGTYTITFCYAKVTFTSPYAGSGLVLQSVVLPNSTTWTLAYTPSPRSYIPVIDLSEITFPTGGTLSYTWTGTYACAEDDSGAENEAVLSRTLNPNDGSAPAQWTYAYGASGGLTTVTDPALNASVHTFGFGGPGTSNGCQSYENQVKYYQGSSGGTLLKTVTTAYQYILLPWLPGGWLPPEYANVVPITEDTTWANGQEAQVSHSYDSGFTVYPPIYDPPSGNVPSSPTITAIYGKELIRKEYDYGNGAPGSLLRTKTTAYLALNNSTYLNANLLNLPSSMQVTGSGPGSNTTYNYDETGSPAGAHGNLTSTHQWLNTTGGYLVTSNVYNSNGLVTSSTDPKGNPTTFGYTGSYAGSGPTTITNALNQSVTNAYDFNTGLLTSTTDPNSKTTSYVYDYMLRATQVTHPDTGQVTFSYPNANQVNITETNNYSPNRLSYLVVDGVGREIRQAVTNGESTPYDEADTCYDGMGRVSFKSYPFQDSGPFTTSRSCGSPEAGDSFAYDALNRETSVTHSDASTVLTSYTGRATNVQDEGNGTQRVQRVSQVDGLGRLASVCEVTSTTLAVGITGSTTPAACGQDIAATGFLTTYAYDALDNLTSVAQGPLKSRTFVYDSLSRLTTSSNPEAGTTGYTYDADGNVVTKLDARGTTICYGAWSGGTCNGAAGYDAINELLEKSYSDGTPTVTYNYGQASAMGVTLTNTIGRRSSESTAGSYPTGSVFSYDPMGRVNIDSQCTPQNCSGTPFSIVYTYDFLGDVHTSTNGAAVTLTNSYNAGARLTTFTSSLSDSNHPGTPFGYQNLAHYNAAGSILSVTLGNGVNETRTYDGRLRLTGITDGSVYTLTIPSGYAPNNDILAANDSVNGNWNYAYDGFNRLCASNQGGQTSLLCTSTNNTGQKAFTYAYDRFGNRWNQTITAGSGPAPSYGFDANNHITGATGVTYDAAGDTTGDGTHTYTYDAEGRVSQVDGGTTGTYLYDAEGRRVRKTTVAGGTVDFLYDLAGHEISQITSTGTWTRGEVYAGGRHLATYSGGTGGTTIFNHADWLGTERARSNVSGALCESITSLPFGDAMSTSGSCGDPSPMHFTAKERDTESNLDNFGARYDSSSMGRFMSPDPLYISKKKFIDPQQWNMYSYTRNNPLRFVDPTGRSIELTGNDEERKRQLQALQKAAGKAGSYLYDNVDKKTGNHYVGIYTNGPDGKGPSFNSVNAVSNKLGGIIQDSRVATVQFVDPGTSKAGQQVGAAPGMSPAVTFAGSNAATVFVTRGTLGTFPGTLAADGQSETISLDEVLTHELGHVDSKWFHNGTDTNGDAVRIENQVRQEDGLPMRIGHSEPYDVPLSDMPF